MTEDTDEWGHFSKWLHGDRKLPCFFAYMGIACDLVFANLGAAYGTAKSGVVYMQWV